MMITIFIVRKIKIAFNQKEPTEYTPRTEYRIVFLLFFLSNYYFFGQHLLCMLFAYSLNLTNLFENKQRIQIFNYIIEREIYSHLCVSQVADQNQPISSMQIDGRFLIYRAAGAVYRRTTPANLDRNWINEKIIIFSFYAIMLFN